MSLSTQIKKLEEQVAKASADADLLSQVRALLVGPLQLELQGQGPGGLMDGLHEVLDSVEAPPGESVEARIRAMHQEAQASAPADYHAQRDLAALLYGAQAAALERAAKFTSIGDDWRGLRAPDRAMVLRRAIDELVHNAPDPAAPGMAVTPQDYLEAVTESIDDALRVLVEAKVVEPSALDGRSLVDRADDLRAYVQDLLEDQERSIAQVEGLRQRCAELRARESCHHLEQAKPADLERLDAMIADEQALTWDFSAKDRAMLKRLRVLVAPVGDPLLEKIEAETFRAADPVCLCGHPRSKHQIDMDEEGDAVHAQCTACVCELCEEEPATEGHFLITRWLRGARRFAVVSAGADRKIKWVDDVAHARRFTTAADAEARAPRGAVVVATNDLNALIETDRRQAQETATARTSPQGGGRADVEEAGAAPPRASPASSTEAKRKRKKRPRHATIYVLDDLSLLDALRDAAGPASPVSRWREADDVVRGASTNNNHERLRELVRRYCLGVAVERDDVEGVASLIGAPTTGSTAASSASAAEVAP